MPQSLAQVYLHLVFSTKHRRPFLRDDDLRTQMHKYLGGACRNLESPSLQIGGVEDHIHILCRLSRKLSVSELVAELKRESSKWIKTKEGCQADFHWQDGYGAFSLSPSHVEALTEYIGGQADHHRRESFQEEFRRLLQKYEMPCDERYVWD
jgi:REP element-mobilizing transposase RayT